MRTEASSRAPLTDFPPPEDSEGDPDAYQTQGEGVERDS